jgi:TatD DNase family protein
MTAQGFDFHCHIDLLPEPPTMIAALERMHIVTIAVTTTPKAWNQNRQWTNNSQYVHPAIGLHPELAGPRRGEVDLLERLLPQTTLIGEIGLDGTPEHRKDWPAQTEVFVRTLKVAEQLGGRVASIHSRHAAREVLACLAEHTTARRVLPVLHWFSDGPTLVRQAVEQGCFFSINSRMLESESGAAIARQLPTDRILTETDAPFTDKKGFAEQRPQNVLATARRLAKVRGVTNEEMNAILTANSQRVFAFAGLTLTGVTR